MEERKGVRKKQRKEGEAEERKSGREARGKAKKKGMAGDWQMKS